MTGRTICSEDLSIDGIINCLSGQYPMGDSDMDIDRGDRKDTFLPSVTSSKRNGFKNKNAWP